MAPQVGVMDFDRERHYEQAMKVAQAAWDYVNPPDGKHDRSSDQERYRCLRDEVHRLHRLELNLPPPEVRGPVLPWR